MTSISMTTSDTSRSWVWKSGFRRVAVFGEARWLFLETDVDSALDELENLDEADIDGLGINVGLLFRF